MTEHSDEKLQRELARQALLFRITQRSDPYRVLRLARERLAQRRPKRPAE